MVNLPGQLSDALVDHAQDGYDQFYVYVNRDSGLNHYYPSWITNQPSGHDTLTIDTASLRSAGNTAIQCVWTGESGRVGGRWNGVGLVEPENYDGTPVGQAYALFNGQPAPQGSRLVFEARVDSHDTGDAVEFGFGGPSDSAAQRRWIQLDQTWRQFSIDVSGLVLSPLHVGFIASFNDTHDVHRDGVTAYLDNIAYTWPRSDSPRLLRSYLVEPDQGAYSGDASITAQQWFDVTHANTAYTYDQDVALLALQLDGNGTDARSRLAEAIGNGLYEAWSHDWSQSPRTGPPLNQPPDSNNATSNRLYDAWMEGDPLDNQLHYARPAGWTVGAEVDPVHAFWMHNYGMDTGVHFWTVLSLTTLWQRTGDPQYLQMATRLAEWVVDNMKDPAGGFFIGYDVNPADGWSQVKVKSTEMNTDGYVALRRLAQVYAELGDDAQAARWLAESLHAGDFVINHMYDHDAGRFYVGTTINSATGAEEISPDNYVIDAQSWTILAFASSPDYAEAIPDWSRQLRWAEQHLAADGGGFDFGYDRRVEQVADGRWLEGEAGVALAYLTLEDDAGYTQTMELIAHEYVVAGQPLMPASNRADGVTTGFMVDGETPWLIFERGHVAAHAWGMFAVSAYNPFWDTVITWCNPWNNRDVNLDGYISPIDALLVINLLNRTNAGSDPPPSPQAPAPYLDTNDDRHISPIDALLVINYLNARGSAEGENGSVLQTVYSSSSKAVDPLSAAISTASILPSLHVLESGDRLTLGQQRGDPTVDPEWSGGAWEPLLLPTPVPAQGLCLHDVLDAADAGSEFHAAGQPDLDQLVDTLAHDICGQRLARAADGAMPRHRDGK